MSDFRNCKSAASPRCAIVQRALGHRAIGEGHPDVYKRYKLSADPNAVFEELQTYVHGNGLDLSIRCYRWA
jgi:hypothetical protein